MAAAGDTVDFDSTVFPPVVPATSIVAVLGSFDVTDDDLIVDGGGRVRLDGSQAAAGVTAIRVDADRVSVTGFVIDGFPGSGIRVLSGTGHVIGQDALGDGIWVEDTGGAGIWVGHPVNVVSEVIITSATVGRACGAPSGACGGIVVQGLGGVSDVSIADTYVYDTKGAPVQSQGIGILISSGTGHLIKDSTVGIESGNRAHGIAVFGSVAPITATVRNSVVGQNLGSGIHLGPSSEGCVIDGNLIGINADGDVAGNGQHGVSIFASDFHEILNNVISDNGMSGIRMAGAANGNWQSNHTIRGNKIGVNLDGTEEMGNGEYGILSQGEHGQSDIGGPLEGEGNIVSGNAKHGIRLDDHSHSVLGNRVGTDVTGTIALSNGTAAGSWAGVFIDAPLVQMGAGGERYSFLPELGSMNQVSGNIGDGIRVRSGSETMVRGNLVGAGADGDAPLGNTSHGIVVLGAYIEGDVGGTDTSERNIVLDNGGDGIRLESSNGPFLGGQISSNMVGRGLLGTITGNGGDGIALIATNQPIEQMHILSNLVQGNGGVGLRLSGATEVEVRANLFDQNGECAMLFENGANPAAVPAVVEDANPYSINGSFPVGTPVDDLEVFWDGATTTSDEADEASHLLGDATFDTVKGKFSLLGDPLVDDPFPTNGRVSALLTANGETSSLEVWCEDGCAASGAGTCNDGDVCSTDTCTAGVGCEYGNAAAGTVCDDGNACSHALMSLTDECNAVGTCVGSVLMGGCSGVDFCEDGSVVRDCSDANLCGTRDTCNEVTGVCDHTPADIDCADQDKCTADQCDPAHGCVYTPRDAEFYCDHDLDACTELATCNGAGTCIAAEEVEVVCPTPCDAAATSTCDPATGCDVQLDCMIMDGLCSADEICKCDQVTQDCAGFGDPASPLYDVDLDGIPDTWELDGLDTDCDGLPDYFPPLGTVGVPTVWLEIDYMVADDHSHDPKAGVTEALIDAFNDGGGVSGTRPWELIIDVSSSLPHYDALSMTGQSPDQPTCNSWVLLQDLKRQYSDMRRRSLYHYVIMGHKQGGCNGTTTGWSGIPGQNFMVTLGGQLDESGLPVGTFAEQTGTIMHELGHNLGLRHGGHSDEPDSNVTYQSVMSYTYSPSLFEWPSVDIRRYDYSREERTFDENALDEIVGFNTANPEDFRYEIDKQCADAQSPVGPLNWNCNVDALGAGVIDTGLVAAQLDEFAALGVVTGREDWWTLDSRFQCGAGGGAYGLLPPPDGAGELTREEMAARGLLIEPIRAEVDPMPSCVEGPIAEDGTGKVQVLVYGAPSFDVIDLELSTVRLSDAFVLAHQVLDYDQDQIDDIVLEVEVSSMVVYLPAPAVILAGVTTGGERVVGGRPLYWVPIAVDDDADGVPNDCDLCVVEPGPPASPTGCP